MRTVDPVKTYIINRITPIGGHVLTRAEMSLRTRAGTWECSCGNRGGSTEAFAGEDLRGKLITGWRSHAHRAVKAGR